MNFSLSRFFNRESKPQPGDARILLAADNHAGHRTGLTPPRWWDDISFKWGRQQRELWKFYTEVVDAWKPFDFVLWNGDAISGKGERQGGTQHITVDRAEQAEIAMETILQTGCRVVRMSYGTPYHVGASEDWENMVVEKLRGKRIDCGIKSHVFLNVNGREINMKHKIESSTVHHGRMTPLAKHIDWNRWWASIGVQPRADILIRSHVHYSVGPAYHDGCLGIVTPSLQGLGDKYGSRQCVGTVEFGLIFLTISKEGAVSWDMKILTGESQRDESEVLSVAR